eukprot:11333131-Karenia_brevis.AAC.1
MEEGGVSKRLRPVGSPSLNPRGRKPLKSQSREEGDKPQSTEGKIAKAKAKFADAVNEWRDARGCSTSE